MSALVIGYVDTSVQDEQVVASTVGVLSVSVSAKSLYAAFPACTLAVEVSPDGINWLQAAYLNRDTGVATNVSDITADAIRRNIPTSDVQYVRVRNKTPAGTQRIEIAVYAEQSARPLSTSTVSAPIAGDGGVGSITAPSASES